MTNPPPPIEIRPRGWIVAITASLVLWALIFLAICSLWRYAPSL